VEDGDDDDDEASFSVIDDDDILKVCDDVDDNNDEEDGYDETLIPCDYASNGQIRDDAIFDTLVQPMPGGVTMTCLMDCCHSGTVMDLPYKYSAQSDTTEMQEDEDFNFDKFFTFMKKAFGFFQRNF